MSAEINIHGQIVTNEEAAFFGGFSSSMLKEQLNLYKDEKEIIVNITSPGGLVTEGFAIYDMLRDSGKHITTRGTGLIASIATVIFLAGDKRELSENAEFMVHNSHVSIAGDSLEAKDLEKMAGEAKRIESKIKNFYATKLNKSVEEIASLTDSETFMSTDEAIKLGFAHAKINQENQLKAVAYLEPQKIKNMDKESFISKLKSAVNDVFKAEAPAGAVPVRESYLITTKDGKKMMVEQTESGSVVGGKVYPVDENGERSEDALESGSFTSDDGNEYKVEGGEIVSFEKKEPEEDEVVEEVAEAKTKMPEEEDKVIEEKITYEDKKKIKELEAKIEEMSVAFSEMPAVIAQGVAEGINELKAVISSQDAPSMNSSARVEAHSGMSAIQRKALEVQERIRKR